ncbi:MAG: D-aminoacylase [Clostridia bacterium]|nr:D-aminoacylase [Clostridia bacterium]
MYNLIIKNAKIIDGTGSPSFFSDIGIKEDKIAKIAKGLDGAEKTIDAKGLTVTPGFIDSHSHSDNALLTYPDLVEKIEQGITTSVAGNCGDSVAPMSKDSKNGNPVCKTVVSFINALKDESFGSNTALLVGHSALREAVIGPANRVPDSEELKKMKELLEDGMKHGALGVSFGLIYAPSCYSKTEELIEIAKVVGKYHGIVSAHIRNEGNTLVNAVEEFIRIIKESGARGVISHHKSAGKENWGKVNHTLRMIDDANNEGLEIYCDVYPYIASHTSLAASFVPQEARCEGTEGLKRRLQDPNTREEYRAWNKAFRGDDDLSWVQVALCTGMREYEGMKIPEVARARGTDVYDAIFDMISAGYSSACYFTMCEEDVKTVLKYPRAMICTDSSVARNNTVYHPRLRGTFPRVLGKYIREEKVTTLPEMIRKMTAMPAMVYGFENKGLIRMGMDADICIFDEEKITDRATFEDCSKRADGLNYVILGGEVVVENAVYNGTRKGRVILRNG